MNTSTDQNRFQELSKYFTSDAWQLISSFITNLQVKMDQFNIKVEEQTTVFSGIEEFILEFIEAFKDRAKITFTEALELIQDIGSPSEIIQSMDIPILQEEKQEETIQQKEKPIEVIKQDKVTCKACYWKNEPDSLFCDNCGARIAKKISLPRIPQEIILSPYISAMAICYLILVIYRILLIVIAYSPLIDPDLEQIPNLFDQLNEIALIMIIPAILIGILLGYAIKRIYSTSPIYYRYDVHLAQLQKYFSLGLIISLISIYLCFIYVPIKTSRNEFISLAIILTVVCPILAIAIYKWNSGKKPSDIPYLYFLKRMKLLEDNNLKKIKNYNIVGIIIIASIGTGVISSVLGYNILTIPDWTVYGIPASIAFILSLILLLNGVILIYYYSWLQINRFLHFSKWS